MSLNIPNNTEHWAVVVAQLAERSLPTRGPRFESRHQQFFLFTYFQDENELKEAAANGPISKNNIQNVICGFCQNMFGATTILCEMNLILHFQKDDMGIGSFL